MALFKILRGSSNGLEALPLKDGYCYFTSDTGLFYIDYEKDGELKRIPLNAANAATLSGANLVHDILSNNMNEIPSSALLSKEINRLETNKLDKITGEVGQVIGVGDNGDLIAMDAAISAGGLIDTNSGALIKLWYGTKEEYDALDPKDDYTIYILSDEVGGDVLADEIAYDNTLSGLNATNVQVALDEIATTAGKAGYVLETNKGLQQKFWRGTKEEYDALTEKDEATMYIVVDDDENENIIVDAYTKAEVDALLANMYTKAEVDAAIAAAIEAAFANIATVEGGNF